MWSVAWFAVVYDTPAQHPRISETERNYLMKVIPQDSNSKGVSVIEKTILNIVFLKQVWLFYVAKHHDRQGLISKPFFGNC